MTQAHKLPHSRPAQQNRVIPGDWESGIIRFNLARSFQQLENCYYNDKIELNGIVNGAGFHKTVLLLYWWLYQTVYYLFIDCI